jgi:ABC-type uncharacterized transport system substrate-binding protein
LLLITCLGSSGAGAHPHSFVECELTIVFDQEGLAGFRQRWNLDEMTTIAVLDLIGAFGAKELTPELVAAVKEQSMGSLRQFGYFTDVRINGERFEVEWIRDFRAELHAGKLVYEFFAPCHVKAAEHPKEVKVAVYDDSFYTYVTYVSDESSGLDPTLDPKFADPTAPARPDDFERFSKALGINDFEGKAKLDGPLDNFEVQAEVREAPEMKYFMDQIVPEAFVIRFSKK